jgi:peptide/nickel transport system permease protein
MTKHIRKAKTTPKMQIIKFIRTCLKQQPWLTTLVIVSCLVPLLTNSKPLACKQDGKWYFPAWYDYVGAYQLYHPDYPLRQIALQNTWKTHQFEAKIGALISHDPAARDTDHRKAPPGTPGHWLGTDTEGRDVVAGLISGARVALTIGLLALLAASFLGVTIGAVAGYFGDSGWQLSRWHLLVTFPLLCIFTVICYTVWHYVFEYQPLSWWLRLFGGWSLVLFLCAFGKSRLPLRHWLYNTVAIPIDLITQRIAEVLNSLPKLIILTIIIAMQRTMPSLAVIALIAGAFAWPGIAAFVRAEMLRVRSLDYIAAARLSGLPQWKVVLRHALPNALPPAYVAMALFAANAILLETSLSFLGIRKDPDVVSWGSLMLGGGASSSTWWLAIFPGLCITLTIYSLYQTSMRRSSTHIPVQ